MIWRAVKIAAALFCCTAFCLIRWRSYRIAILYMGRDIVGVLAQHDAGRKIVFYRER